MFEKIRIKKMKLQKKYKIYNLTSFKALELGFFGLFFVAGLRALLITLLELLGYIFNPQSSNSSEWVNLQINSLIALSLSLLFTLLILYKLYKKVMSKPAYKLNYKYVELLNNYLSENFDSDEELKIIKNYLDKFNY